MTTLSITDILDCIADNYDTNNKKDRISLEKAISIVSAQLSNVWLLYTEDNIVYGDPLYAIGTCELKEVLTNLYIDYVQFFTYTENAGTGQQYKVRKVTEFVIEDMEDISNE